jgi:glycine/D-amino acid oxidase-like deaminating enzyme
VSYFERPLCQLAESFGFERAIAAQRDIDGAWDLLDQMAAEAGAKASVQSFQGHMGMFSPDHLSVHLRNNLLRERGGLETEACVVSEDAEFLGELDPAYRRLYTIVPQRRVQELLETGDARYRAVLSHRKGCANGALLCQQVLDRLLASHPERFRYFDDTPVERVSLGAHSALLAARGRRISAARVVLCTNGFADPIVENRAGADIRAQLRHRIHGDVGYMAALVEPAARPPTAISYLMSPRIGQGQAYFYVTRRPFAVGGRAVTLTCIGGPDLRLDDRGAYRAEDACPDEMLERLDAAIRPILAPGRAEPLPYAYAWHGLMAYTQSQVRLIGPEPRNPRLLYNLGCNGVGFLPSIYGGRRLARIVAGERLAPSLFDPS